MCGGVDKGQICIEEPLPFWWIQMDFSFTVIHVPHLALMILNFPRLPTPLLYISRLWGVVFAARGSFCFLIATYPLPPSRRHVYFLQKYKFGFRPMLRC